MKISKILTRTSVALAVVTLAACQTPSVQQGSATQAGPAVATPAPAPTAPPAPDGAMQPGAEQGAQVAVFLADMKEHPGWRPVKVGGDSTLYLDPYPVFTRDDLTGVQAGTNKDGQGLLALMLNDDAKRRVQELTTQHPNRRLALVVGSTLMAAPPYSEPVSTGQLIFPVGTEQNAMNAARAIAGVENGAAGPATGSAVPSTTGAPR